MTPERCRCGHTFLSHNMFGEACNACDCATWDLDLDSSPPAAGGVPVDPPEHGAEVLFHALWDSGVRMSIPDFRRAAVYLHERGYRRVTEGHQVVPDGRVWLKGREYAVGGGDVLDLDTHVWTGVTLRPVGAAGGEGTDGDQEEWAGCLDGHPRYVDGCFYCSPLGAPSGDLEGQT